MSFYRDFVNEYNASVERFQRYIRNEPMRDEKDFHFYNLLYSFNVPYRQDLDGLKSYMDFYGFDWSDLTMNVFRNYGQQERQAISTGYNFASRSVHKLYK